MIDVIASFVPCYRLDVCSMLPSLFLKFVGICLLVFGVYDTNVYWYALARGEGTFDFFGRNLAATHSIVRAGFSLVLVFYYAVGSILLVLG
ncbi:MAG TPA: hypothetical protein VEC43_02940 [Candidatus Acidoferrales bacterium]|nr:hypothetical protein [Candidatus Acidoferrales bacterium]